MKQPLNVVFMGTPQFATPSLQALHDMGCRVSLVVTRPDQPKGRGRRMGPPPVKIAATGLGYPVLQPESVKTEAFYDSLKALAPDIMVVVAFGHVLPKKVLDIPILGAINVHASLLPKYRGPAPIQWAIINGDDRTGVTTMLMDKGLDTGEILGVLETPILPEDTSQTLHDRLSHLGAQLLKQTLAGLENQSIRPVPQNHALATHAPMLQKQQGHIDWGLSAVQIDRMIRGMTPWPGAFTFLGEKRIHICRAMPLSGSALAPPGTVLAGLSNEIRVAAGSGALSITELQGASGKRLKAADYLRGSALHPGAVLR